MIKRYGGKKSKTKTFRFVLSAKDRDLIKGKRTSNRYGSQGRAIQVAVEILSRNPYLVDVPKECDDSIRITYKLLPITITQIKTLKERYGGTVAIFGAVAHLLEEGF